MEAVHTYLKILRNVFDFYRVSEQKKNTPRSPKKGRPAASRLFWGSWACFLFLKGAKIRKMRKIAEFFFVKMQSLQERQNSDPASSFWLIPGPFCVIFHAESESGLRMAKFQFCQYSKNRSRSDNSAANSS